jgi:hypothetical protein
MWNRCLNWCAYCRQHGPGHLLLHRKVVRELRYAKWRVMALLTWCLLAPVPVAVSSTEHWILVGGWWNMRCDAAVVWRVLSALAGCRAVDEPFA